MSEPLIDVQALHDRIMRTAAKATDREKSLPCIFDTLDIGTCTEEFAEKCSFHFNKNTGCPRRQIEARRIALVHCVALMKKEGVPSAAIKLVMEGTLVKTEARANVKNFMDSGKTILALCGPVHSGKSTAAVEAMIRQQGGQYLRPSDLLQGGITAPWLDRARQCPLTVLDGLSRDDMHLDFAIINGTLRWLTEAAFENEKKLIITIDDQWDDQPNVRNPDKPIRGISTLIGPATLNRILTDGVVAQVARS